MRTETLGRPCLGLLLLAAAVVFLGSPWLGLVSIRADDDSPDDDTLPEREVEDEGDSQKIRFVLPHVEALPGEEFVVPLQIQGPVPMAMVSWSVQYDGRFLEFLGVDLSSEVAVLMEAHAAEESLFEWFTTEDDDEEEEEEEDEEEDEEDDRPDGVDEPEATEREESGWFQAIVVTDFDAREEFSISAGAPVTLAYLRFRVYEDTPAGGYDLEFSTEEDVRFKSRFEAEDGKVVYNVTAGSGTPLTQDALYNVSAQVGLENGTIRVLSLPGDIGIFRRGDANLDEQIDITDPLRALRFLFLDAAVEVCLSTADADANGALELTDSVVVLEYLFLQSGWVPEPVHLSRIFSGDPSRVGGDCTW